MKYPIGPLTQEKAAQTVPGQLAILLNRLLYVGDNKSVIEEGWSQEQKAALKRWVAPDQIYKNDDVIPPGMARIADRPNYFETESLLQAIRDYLEFKSLEEVIP